jgi:uncharacterized protein YndB with AHSA1/START domain
MPELVPDVIEERVFVKADRRRVWRALVDPREFGSWFGMDLDGAFAAGRTVRGRITHPGYEHLAAEFHVERVEPERVLAFRWHPHAVNAAVDYSAEPTTLVQFRLDGASGGTALVLSESGFDRIPQARREAAYRANRDGWRQQMENLRRHVGN